MSLILETRHRWTTKAGFQAWANMVTKSAYKLIRGRPLAEPLRLGVESLDPIEASYRSFYQRELRNHDVDLIRKAVSKIGGIAGPSKIGAIAAPSVTSPSSSRALHHSQSLRVSTARSTQHAVLDVMDDDADEQESEQALAAEDESEDEAEEHQHHVHTKEAQDHKHKRLNHKDKDLKLDLDRDRDLDHRHEYTGAGSQRTGASRVRTGDAAVRAQSDFAHKGDDA